MALNDFKDTNQEGGVLTVSNSNIGRGIKYNPNTKQYEVDIVDLTAINNSINRLSNEVEGLKNKSDRDTVYDDTSLRNQLNSLSALVNSMQNTETPNTGTTSNVKFFKVPLSVSSSVYSDQLHTRYSVSYTINENIDNIQAIECIGIITGGRNANGLSVDIPLNINNRNNTSILVQGGGNFAVDSGGAVRDRYNTGYGMIILYLK